MALAPSEGKALTLQYTIPKYKATTVWDDSTQTWQATCGTDSLNLATNLQYIRIYRAAFEGGGYLPIRDKDVSGRGGQSDTLDVPDDGNYYVTPIDSLGHEGCASVIVHGNIPTGVNPLTDKRKLIKDKLFDCQGRFLFDIENEKIPEEKLASGIYFRLQIFDDHSKKSSKVLVMK